MIRAMDAFLRSFSRSIAYNPGNVNATPRRHVRDKVTLHLHAGFEAQKKS
jgi:hypothetical protein